jgi:hypothetical protein
MNLNEQHSPGAFEHFAKFVRSRHPSEVLPKAWVAPRRLAEQENGRRRAMTFGELQAIISDDPMGLLADIQARAAARFDRESGQK